MTLPPRQLQIMHLVCSGLANKQIADRLGISENTVKNHMKVILKKYKCQCRARAVFRFLCSEHRSCVK